MAAVRTQGDCLVFFSFLSANSFHPLVVFVFVVISFNLFIIGKKTLLVGQVGELVRGCHLVVRLMVMMVLMMMTMVMMVLMMCMKLMMWRYRTITFDEHKDHLRRSIVPR